MATVNKPGGIIAGIDVPEWNVENSTTNSRLTIVLDPIKIDNSGPGSPVAGTCSLYCDFFDLENGVNVRYPIMEAENIVFHGLG